MIGLGTWEARIDTMFFKGQATVRIFDDNGSYGFEVKAADFTVPDIEVVSVEEEDEHIDAVVRTSALKGKDIDLSVDIDGDEITGFVKVPMLGKIKLKDGHRVD